MARDHALGRKAPANNRKAAGGGARQSATRNKTRLLPQPMADMAKRRALQAAGVLLCLAAAVVALTLISYDSADPSLNRVGPGAVQNWLGEPGAVVSDILFQSVGLAAFLIVAVGLVWGARMARGRQIGTVWWRLTLLPAALLFAATAMAPVAPWGGWPTEAGPGGFIGKQVYGGTAALLRASDAWVGPTLIALTAAVLAMLIMTPVLGVPWNEWQRGLKGMRRSGAWLFGLARRSPSDGKSRDKVERAAERTKPSTAKASSARRKRKAKPEIQEPRPVPPTMTTPPRRTVAKKSGSTAQGARRTGTQTNLAFEASGFTLPPIDLLQAPDPGSTAVAADKDALAANARYLETVLSDFGVKGKVVKVSPGPVVTLYELEPAPGTKSARVIGLAGDIARSMSAVSVRVAVIPGRNVIGIELPNSEREMVYLRELLGSDAFARASAKDAGGLPLILGKDIAGTPVIADLARMPHLLIAGTTGSGKSVGINTMILSLLYRLPPERCRVIMIDPKMLELSIYDGIPHLLSPVVTDPKKAIVALRWAVREMEERYQAMSKLGVRNIDGYNARLADAKRKGEVLTHKVQSGLDEAGQPIVEDQPIPLDPLPYLVLIVDEMADLMLVAGKDIEAAVQRLAQMARAAGIHLIMATQRPSVDVITGTIKANFPTRISFQVTSKIDSRTILGDQGAEQLLGQGDMLYMAGGGRITRVHGPFVSDEEVEAVVAHLRAQGTPAYVDDVTEEPDTEPAGLFGGDGDSAEDALYRQAVELVLQEDKCSTSFIQRKLAIGYNRAARLVERMEEEGVVSPANHAGKRQILAGGV